MERATCADLSCTIIPGSEDSITATAVDGSGDFEVSSDVSSCPAEFVDSPEKEAQESRRIKLQKVIQELKINEINIPKAEKHRLIEISNKNLEAFALDDNDLGHTDLIEQPIEVGEN